MSMNIKDETAHAMARELAGLLETSLTGAVRAALARELERVRKEQADPARHTKDRLHELALQCAALPDLDDRTPDQIVGYDPTGLPS